jgi:AraC-like DNA-binding protein
MKEFMATYSLVRDRFEVSRPTPEPLHDWRVSRVAQELLAKSGRVELTLARASETLRLTPAHLGRRFKRTVGIGFRQFAATARLENVALLLQGSTLSIKEIATKAGYKHASDLNHSFKKSYGMSPREFRQRSGL